MQEAAPRKDSGRSLIRNDGEEGRGDEQSWRQEELDEEEVRSPRRRRQAATVQQGTGVSSPMRSVTATRSSSGSGSGSRSSSRHLPQDDQSDVDVDTLRLLGDLLPPIPSHIAVPPSSSSSSSASSGTPRRANATSAQSPLKTHIESVAQAELRAIRQESLHEVYDLLRQRRREIVAREAKIRTEALKLLAKVEPANVASSVAILEYIPVSGQQKASPSISMPQQQTPSSAATQSVTEGSPLFERRKPTVPSSLGATSSFGTSLGDNNGTPTFSSSAMPFVQGLRAGAKSTKTEQSTAAGPALSSSVGALSASFAMRGRDPPPALSDRAPPTTGDGSTSTGSQDMRGASSKDDATSSPGEDEERERERQREREEDEEDWYAHKRRMRERYPHADHSALPSAANSDDEETGVRLKGGWAHEDNDDDEGRDVWQGKRDEERRGRKERRRKEDEENEQKEYDREGGLRGRGRGRGRERNVALSSSMNLEEKSRALTGISEGSAGALLSPTNSRREGPKKGALKSSSSSTDAATTSTPDASKRASKDAKSALQYVSGVKVEATSEKKVMFADNAEEVGQGAFVADEEEDDDEDGTTEKRLNYTEPVDEGANALFDIDEDIDESKIGEDRNGQERSTEEFENELRKGQEELLEEEAKNRGAVETMQTGEEEAGSGRTDDLPYEEHIAQSVPHVGSFAALVEAQSAQPGSASLPRRDSFGSGVQGIRSPDRHMTSHGDFDPASLRLDGRQSQSVVPPQRGVADVDFNTTPRRGGALPNFFPSDDRGDSRAMMGSNIGFRVAVNEAEARLSGLLAPHAPSHRDLWTGAGRWKSASGRNSSKERAKYIDEDAEDEGEEDLDVDNNDDQDDGNGGRSWRRRRQAAAKAAAATTISTSDETKFAPSSVPIAITSPSGGRSFGGRSGAFASFAPGSNAWQRDDTSGFDLEPKTSLPYREKKMTPSLRKATRRVSQTASAASTLPTIADAAETTSSASSSAGTTRGGTSLLSSQPSGEESFKPGKPPMPTRRSSGNVNAAVAASAAAMAATSSSKASEVAMAVAGKKEASKPTIGFDPNEASVSVRSPIPTSAAIATPQAAKLAAPDSGKATPMTSSPSSTSSARRSPQPPYVAPPPPRTTNLRLQPDPALRPAPLTLFDAACDDTLASNEVGEEEETDYAKVLHFMHRVERLKINKRTGWLHHRIEKAESIADHMYRMALLSLLLPGKEEGTSDEGVGNDEKTLLDLGKCVQLCIVHDLAEAEVGDLTPKDGVDPKEKLRREAAAIQYLVHDLLGSSAAGLRIERLWNEYEARETAEAKVVKDLDRFELCLQAVEYERENDIRDLQPFFLRSINLITHVSFANLAKLVSLSRPSLD